MHRRFPSLAPVLAALALIVAVAGAQPAWSAVQAQLESTNLEVGDRVTVTGQIEPGQDLFVTIASQNMFAPQDAKGVNEVKSFKSAVEDNPFNMDTTVPHLFYILTNKPDTFGDITKKRFGGPSFANGIYSTTMFNLKDWNGLSSEAKSVLGPITSQPEWSFFRYNHENSYGINTVTKERTQIGKVTIFARSVLTDYENSGNYWDEGTKIDLNKETGEFTASFESFRHSPPDTEFNVYVNGQEIGSYTLAGKGFWLDLGGRYMNPLWIILGAILVGAFFSLIGAAGGMLMAAYQVMVVNTMGPVGVNAANVLRPSNVALTLFSPLGSFYRYAIKERRVAWPVGLSFGVGILIGSIWLGKYVTAYLPLSSYKEWLAVLVVLMGIRTLYELTPKVMEKRKNIKAMTKKFNEEVAKAKAEGRAAQMGSIEPVKTGLTNYQFKFWGEEFKINPLLFGIIGLGIGIVARCFGIGGGFLLVPIMTMIGGLPMYVAVPVGLVGTCFSSIGSFIGYLLNGYLPDLWIAIAIIIGGFVGGTIGSRLQSMFTEKQLKWTLAIVLFFLFFRFFKIEIWL
ncbi:sulfite exporter TauE/SafE family protein [Desulfovermiculus halophilus]|uniref:sulfite exporter TauE/SafE family protein n=1 Tax=Desulfovermiculus halophilus TaxID=339722 RepID=UPI0004804F2F|nr:sulfite exporter TauE/SafE family protein [Desulfovermiculus halophilus]